MNFRVKEMERPRIKDTETLPSSLSSLALRIKFLVRIRLFLFCDFVFPSYRAVFFIPDSLATDFVVSPSSYFLCATTFTRREKHERFQSKED